MSGCPPGPSAASDLVILRCPSCNAAEPVKAAALSERPQMVRCRRCGTHWPARKAMAAEDAADPRRQSVLWADASTVDDIRRPLVGYADDKDPWAASRDAPPPPEERAVRRPVPRIAALATAIAFLAGAVVGREAAVAAVPDLAGLYAAVGLPVNLTALEIADVSGARRVTGQAVRLTVSGLVTNVGSRRREVPPLVISLHDEAGRSLAEELIAPPIPSLENGAVVRFVVDLEHAPRDATTIKVRFDTAVAAAPGAFGASGAPDVPSGFGGRG